jgi:hypothetical protein
MEIAALCSFVIALGLLGWNTFKDREMGSASLWKVAGLSLVGLAILTSLGGFTQSVVDWMNF